MSDLYCRVCGEPYDAYGVRKDGKGDMAAWEAKLFLLGAGCPSCAGVQPDNGDPDAKFEKFGTSLLIDGFDDFGHADAIIDGSLEGKPPEWKRPEDVVLHTCSWCLDSAVLDQDDNVVRFGDQEFRDAQEVDEYFVDAGTRHYCTDCYVECGTAGCKNRVLEDSRRYRKAKTDDETDQLAQFSAPGEFANAKYCKDCYELLVEEEITDSLRSSIRDGLREGVTLEDDVIDLLFGELRSEISTNSDGTANSLPEETVYEALKPYFWDQTTGEFDAAELQHGYAACASLLVQYREGSALDLALLSEREIQEACDVLDVSRAKLRDYILEGKL